MKQREEAIRSIVAGSSGAPRAAVRLAHRHPKTFQSNRLYDAWVEGSGPGNPRHLIVKEFLKPDEFQEAPVREHRALQLLAPMDVAPQPLSHHPPTPSRRPLVIYEYMEGKMWNRRRPTAEELQQLASLWLEVNSVTAKDLWLSRGYEQTLAETAAGLRAMLQKYASWAEAAFEEGRRAAGLVLELLESRSGLIHELDEDAAPLCFCRSDARFANVIRRPDGRLGMVDWEDSGLRDPARDVADVLTAPNQEDLLTWQEWQAFLRPYAAGRRAQDPGLLARTHRYLGLFPLAWIAWLTQADLERAAAGTLASWKIHGMPANERLRRYLARALAWPDGDFTEELASLSAVRCFPRSRPAGK